MKFDGAPIQYDTPFHSPGISCPMEEHDEDIKIEEILISSGYGIYIPQMFTELFEKKMKCPSRPGIPAKKAPTAKMIRMGKIMIIGMRGQKYLTGGNTFAMKGMDVLTSISFSMTAIFA